MAHQVLGSRRTANPRTLDDAAGGRGEEEIGKQNQDQWPVIQWLLWPYNQYPYTKSFYEAKRLLDKFKASLGQFPPTTELAVQFLTQFKDRKLNTKARYTHVLGAFFIWYSGEKLPIKIRVPKILPQYVPSKDIDCLIEGIKGKKSHKKSIERDVLLIETARMTGLRRGELANLKIEDLHLGGNDPVLIVRQDKGGKDRAVSLNPHIRDQLASFVKDKSTQESVFGLVLILLTLYPMDKSKW